MEQKGSNLNTSSRLTKMTPLSEFSQHPDEAWDTIGSMQSPMTNEKCFKNLAKVMKGTLTIFHSKADCERVFGLVTKNKTQFRLYLLSTQANFRW